MWPLSALAAPPPRSVASGIEDERSHSARRVAVLRAVAASTFAAVSLVFGGILRMDVWRGAYGTATVYATLAIAVLVAVRRSRRLALASGILVTVLDVTAVHVVQRGMMSAAPDPAVVVAFNLATMCVIVVIASMWMRTWMTLAAVAAGAASQTVLFVEIGAPSASASVFVTLGLVGAACVYASNRVYRLVASTTELSLAQGAAEREVLRVSEEQSRTFRELVEALPDGAVLASAGSIRYANSKLAEMVGESGGDVVARGVCGLVLESEADALSAHLAAATDGRALPVELHLRRADGRRIPVEVTSTHLVVGGSPCTVSVVRDTSERTIVRDQLLLADRMASMGTLAATIAHDINNPVAVVQANLDYMSEHLEGGGQVNDDVLSALADSREAVLSVGGIVRQLKAFSRVEDDAPVSLDVRGVIESSARMAQNQVHSRAQLVFEIDARLHVKAVPSRLGQVVLNLLVNAAQAIPQGAPEANSIVVRAFDEGEQVVIEVEDTGTGMDAAVRARVFEPFFTTKPLGVGTGLGLPVCERIVQAMGGRIEIASTPGVGSTFRVVLPGFRAHAPLSEKRIAARTSTTSRVLAIDDEAALLNAISRVLGDSCELTTVGSATEALTLISSGARFEAILCDLTMPGMTGAAFHQELTRRAPDQASRVAVVSGGAVDPQVISYVERHQLPFLRKPFEAEELRALVTKMILGAPARRRDAAALPRES
jgi:PAS domain S-box-containing protein